MEFSKEQLVLLAISVEYYATHFDRSTCQDSQKLAQSKPEVRQKKSNTMINTWQKQEYRQKQSEANKTIETHQKRVNAGINNWEKIEYRQKQKESHKDLWVDKDFKEYHSHCTSKGTKIAWAYNKQQMLQKQYDTMKKNNTFNFSKSEKASYDLLLMKFDKADIEHPTKPSALYPFKSDFRIISLNLFIECHYGFAHCPYFGSFNPTNEHHIAYLKELQERSNTHKNPNNNRYKNAIYQWTDLDVRKRQCAEDNKLNWLCFYSFEDFKKWYITI